MNEGKGIREKSGRVVEMICVVNHEENLLMKWMDEERTMRNSNKKETEEKGKRKIKEEDQKGRKRLSTEFGIPSSPNTNRVESRTEASW